MRTKVGMPSQAFIDELKSSSLNELVMKLYKERIIVPGRGERSLQMYCCFHLLSNLFWSENSNWAFRPIIVEERAVSTDSEIGDIMLKHDLFKDRIAVWVEIKNYFGRENFTESMINALIRDYEKCTINVKKGDLGVVLLTFDDRELAESLLSELIERYHNVETIVIGG